MGMYAEYNPTRTKTTKTCCIRWNTITTTNHYRGGPVGIDPKLKYCSCGYTFHVSTLQELRMLLIGDTIITCPQCGNRMRFRLVYHTVKVDSKRVLNEQIWENG